MRLTVLFWSKVNKDGPVPAHRPELGPCHLWTGATHGAGYGRFSFVEDGRRVWRSAHRLAFEEAKGPIPPGLEPDHLCRVYACVNPDHLEPITHRENCIRSVHDRAQQKRTP